MKKVLFAAAIVFAGFTTANAQTTPAQTTPATKAPATETAAATQQNQTITAVKAEELPAAVRTAVTGMEDTKGWEIVSANHVKGANEHYEITMRNGEQTKTVKVDKAGKKVS